MKVSHCLIQDHWVAGGLARSSDHLKLSYPRDTPLCVVSVVCRVHNLDTTTSSPPLHLNISLCWTQGLNVKIVSLGRI